MTETLKVQLARQRDQMREERDWRERHKVYPPGLFETWSVMSSETFRGRIGSPQRSNRLRQTKHKAG